MATVDKVGGVLLYIVRHCEVQLDVDGKIRGLQNVNLNDKGEDQAKELTDFFRDIDISQIYSDDLLRTYHTALAIASSKDPHLKVKQDPDLRSWDVGSDLEGLSIDANEDEIRELKMQPKKVPVGGESWKDFENKATSSFLRYIGKALTAPAPIVLVVHGSGLQVMWDYMGLQDKQGEYDSTPLEPSGVAQIMMGRSGYKAKILRGAKVLADA